MANYQMRIEAEYEAIEKLSRRSQRGQINWEKMKRLTEWFKLVGPSINEKGGRRVVKKVCFY